jgi:exo-beta-1,3-glucanase (GH17 family)
VPISNLSKKELHISVGKWYTTKIPNEMDDEAAKQTNPPKGTKKTINI